MRLVLLSLLPVISYWKTRSQIGSSTLMASLTGGASVYFTARPCLVSDLSARLKTLGSLPMQCSIGSQPYRSLSSRAIFGDSSFVTRVCPTLNGCLGWTSHTIIVHLAKVTIHTGSPFWILMAHALGARLLQQHNGKLPSIKYCTTNKFVPRFYFLLAWRWSVTVMVLDVG